MQEVLWHEHFYKLSAKHPFMAKQTTSFYLTWTFGFSAWWFNFQSKLPPFPVINDVPPRWRDKILRSNYCCFLSHQHKPWKTQQTHNNREGNYTGRGRTFNKTGNETILRSGCTSIFPTILTTTIVLSMLDNPQLPMENTHLFTVLTTSRDNKEKINVF